MSDDLDFEDDAATLVADRAQLAFHRSRPHRGTGAVSVAVSSLCTTPLAALSTARAEEVLRWHEPLVVPMRSRRPLVFGALLAFVVVGGISFACATGSAQEPGSTVAARK